MRKSLDFDHKRKEKEKRRQQAKWARRARKKNRPK